MNKTDEPYLNILQAKKKKMLKIFIIYAIIMLIPIAIIAYYFISSLIKQ